MPLSLGHVSRDIHPLTVTDDKRIAPASKAFEAVT